MFLYFCQYRQLPQRLLLRQLFLTSRLDGHCSKIHHRILTVYRITFDWEVLSNYNCKFPSFSLDDCLIIIAIKYHGFYIGFPFYPFTFYKCTAVYYYFICFQLFPPFFILIVIKIMKHFFDIDDSHSLLFRKIFWHCPFLLFELCDIFSAFLIPV